MKPTKRKLRASAIVTPEKQKKRAKYEGEERGLNVSQRALFKGGTVAVKQEDVDVDDNDNEILAEHGTTGSALAVKQEDVVDDDENEEEREEEEEEEDYDSDSEEVQPDAASSSSSSATAVVKVESYDIKPDPAPSSAPSAVKKEVKQDHGSDSDSEIEVDDEVELDDGWLDNFKNYLVEEEKLSKQNIRSVMNRVKDLVSGRGISYKNWGQNIFMANVQIHLDMNFIDLLVDAKEAELRWGRDKGNGWLVRHPIKKLQNFKEHYRREKRRKAKAKRKLASVKSEPC